MQVMNKVFKFLSLLENLLDTNAFHDTYHTDTVSN